MGQDIWVLGASGRSGRGIAARLSAGGHRVVLAGRDAGRLAAVAADLDGDGGGGTGVGGVQVVSGSLAEVLAQLRSAEPAVVVSTVGPFGRTAAQVVDACPPGTSYVDIGNELSGTQAVLDRHDHALAQGSTFVTAAGFGALATETAAIVVCAGRAVPSALRVDAVPSLASAGDPIGQALAGSILDGAPDGGRRVRGGRLVRFPVAGARRVLTTPDGATVTTASLPSGELLAAWRASAAPSVESATSAIPSGLAVRAVFPAMGVALRSPALRRQAIARLARVRLPTETRPREWSWGHARAQWSDGTVREVWLRLGDAQEFTVAAAAEVAARLLAPPRHGAFTPAALFGPSLATDLGAELI